MEGRQVLALSIRRGNQARHRPPPLRFSLVHVNAFGCMLAVRTPGAPQAAREDAAFNSAFPFERQGRLLRSRSISGLFSRSLHSGLHRPDQPVMSLVGVDQDHQIVSEPRIFDVGVLASHCA